MKKYKIGFTDGVYDMFHVGHLNMIEKAKEYCDYLIVGVHSDAIVEEYKHRKTVINENDRVRIIGALKAVVIYFSLLCILIKKVPEKSTN